MAVYMMTSPNPKYLPEGIALQDNFVNRKNERKYLADRILATKHSLLMAPRRYGKTSLALKVAADIAIPFCAMDFLAAYNTDYVRSQIVDKVSRLVFELLPTTRKASHKVLAIFQRLHPEIAIGAFGQKLVFKLSESPLQDITELLLKLDETAQHFNKQAVVFMDEFQQIGQLENHHAIEAAIRHAVERSQNIAYIFSGSNRHLLQQAFGDHGRPLYRLCQTLQLERMTQAAYEKRLQKLAKQRWKKHLHQEALHDIAARTELHPYYMNVLCQLLWDHKTCLTIKNVQQIWHHYVKQQRSIIAHDITQLSPNQRRIVTALAQSPTKELQGAPFTAPLGISASSAQQAASILLRKDIIYRDQEGRYKILDPAVRYYLAVLLWDTQPY